MNTQTLIENESADDTGVADRHPNIVANVTISRDRRQVALHHLHALKDAPKGSGSAYMEDLCRWCDANRVDIISLRTGQKGDVPPGGNMKSTTSSDRLKRFYARFGFRSNYDKRNYRPDLPGNMHRMHQRTHQ